MSQITVAGLQLSLGSPNEAENNANPADRANHTGGVWMLPPGLRGVADAEKPRMQAIGESDRMPLLFRKRP